jgi:two-component system, NtrC family, sensor kinase
VSEKKPPGRVLVSTQYDAGKAIVRIAVEDDGPGIPADQMDYLFSPFVSSKKSRGTGLGLPVSQKIANEHGGKIQVHSEPGKGARFVLEIPAVSPPSDQSGSEATIHSNQEKTE